MNHDSQLSNFQSDGGGALLSSSTMMSSLAIITDAPVSVVTIHAFFPVSPLALRLSLHTDVNFSVHINSLAMKLPFFRMVGTCFHRSTLLAFSYEWNFLVSLTVLEGGAIIHMNPWVEATLEAKTASQYFLYSTWSY